MWDLRRYFGLRYLYTKTLEFEVGYLCHEIVYRYQLVLELYQMAERRFVKFENRNFAPVGYMFYIYTNILQQSQDIIHLCHMLHEIEKKYKGKRGVFDDYGENRDNKVNSSSAMKSELAYEKWLQKQRQEERKRQKERKKYLKQLHKFGMTTTKKKTRNKNSSWPLHYGWSIENW
ncbi:unnamed protein product [Euphydryas editha]|uniref:Uncharacterized protein n=1 Tax=Euphydryas editha TaxID=104508 RepID=A0AAU9T9F2_EUPED|nr:unnamed protein product [Euphydryas editha]